MDLPATVTSSRQASWNPLRIDGADLEPKVLLAAKLIAIALLVTGHLRVYPDEPFLPFLPFS